MGMLRGNRKHKKKNKMIRMIKNEKTRKKLHQLTSILQKFYIEVEVFTINAI
jgi:hypothetical protein